ncbi:MAG: reverse transcriptase-like protein [Kosmotoga sp.]|nr:MAG: reverse transcriptase-like protein [Kosmotoga sp.]
MQNSKTLAVRFIDFLKERGLNAELIKYGTYFANVKYENNGMLKIFIKKSGDNRISLPINIDEQTMFEIMKYWELFNGRNHKGTHLYVDGSFIDNMAGYGYVIVLDNNVINTGSGIIKEDISLRNITGEIMGIITGIENCLENDFKSITIHYDYEGLKKWVTGKWKTNKKLTQLYREKMTAYSRKIIISWHKVAAHSGITYNELADRLAKNAVKNYR